MLRQVAEGVLIHESEFMQSNAVVVQGRAGVLLIDPGVHGHEMACIANDLQELGQSVVAGFSTHPHWDHLLWHAQLGAAPRYGTARCAATVRDRLSAGIDSRRLGIPEQVPLNLLGLITGLPAEMAQVPWDGPQVRIVEHQAHAPGHAALLIEERGVLVAGDMLSDVLIPLLDLNDTADPIEDYLAALRLLEGVAGDVDVFIPGHGAIGAADQVHARIDQDRAYVHALRDGHVTSDRRVGPSATYGSDWLPGAHARQLQRLARMPKLTSPQDDARLDNPTYASLSSVHSRFAQRSGRALRYVAEVAPFLALPSEASEADWRAAIELVAPGAVAAAMDYDSPPPEALQVTHTFELLQMIGADVAGTRDPEAMTLGSADVPEMLELVRQTEPGPFFARTIELGRYVGIRREGALVAMAGERMHFDGWTEISAVCTAPAYRGHGLASRLVSTLAADIQDRSERVFLHVLRDNTNAIRLYEELGFRPRQSRRINVLIRAASD